MPSGTAKPQIYKGKEYPSIKALANELGIFPSYLGVAIKKHPRNIDTAVAEAKARMDPQNNKRGHSYEFRGVVYKTYSDLARKLLKIRPDTFNAKRYELVRKGSDPENAILEAIEYFENINKHLLEVDKKRQQHKDDTHKIAVHAATIIAEEIEKYVRKNPLKNRFNIMGFINGFNSLERIIVKELFLIQTADAATIHLKHIDLELGKNFIVRIFANTVHGTTNVLQWHCIAVRKYNFEEKGE
jgi:hypothetical protein